MKLIIFSLLVMVQLLSANVEKLVKDNCEACHEDASLNILSLSSMTYLTQSELLYVLQKGKMKQQSSHLSIEQLEEIAQYLSSKDTTTISSGPLDNNCSNLLEKSHLDYKASWPSWGFDNLNTRYQPDSSINSSNVNKLKFKWAFGIGAQDVRAQPIVIGLSLIHI